MPFAYWLPEPPAGEHTQLILAEVLSWPLQARGHRELVSQAAALAEARGLKVFDALFLALARQQAAKLLTADAQLARVAV